MDAWGDPALTSIGDVGQLDLGPPVSPRIGQPAVAVDRHSESGLPGVTRPVINKGNTNTQLPHTQCITGRVSLVLNVSDRSMDADERDPARPSQCSPSVFSRVSRHTGDVAGDRCGAPHGAEALDRAPDGAVAWGVESRVVTVITPLAAAH